MYNFQHGGYNIPVIFEVRRNEKVKLMKGIAAGMLAMIAIGVAITACECGRGKESCGGQ